MITPLKTGETLRGRYRVRRIIGQGGMGCIYLADDLRLEGRQCALKEVENDKTLPQNLVKEARDQFLREATVLARLDHPNLPKVSDYFSINRNDYLENAESRRGLTRTHLPPTLFVTHGVVVAPGGAAEDAPGDPELLERRAWAAGGSFPLVPLQRAGFEHAVATALAPRGADRAAEKRYPFICRQFG